MIHPLQTQFFSNLRGVEQMCRLFDQLPDVYLVVKDTSGRFIRVNAALRNRLKLGAEDALIGKTDYELYPRDLADTYRREDLRLMESAEPIIGEIHEVIDQDGTSIWFHTIKEALFDQHNRVVGIVGMMRDYRNAGTAIAPHLEIQTVLDYIRDNHEHSITVKDLSELVGLSPSQFQRRFRTLFHTSPMAQVVRIRIEAARRHLTTSTKTISEISLQTGFYDHSHFSKKFKVETGMSPTEYRHKYALEQESREAGP